MKPSARLYIKDTSVNIQSLLKTPGNIYWGRTHVPSVINNSIPRYDSVEMHTRVYQKTCTGMVIAALL